MSIINQKKNIFGDIAALRVSTEGFPNVKLNSSFPSINNEGDSLTFLTDLLKSLVGFEALKNVVVNTITYNLSSIENDIKNSLKKELRKMVSCSVNPSIPDWLKHQNINPISTGIDLELRKVDYLGVMLIDPESPAGNLLFDDVTAGLNSTDFNTYLSKTIQIDGTQTDWGVSTTGNDILSVTFNSFGSTNNTINVKVSEYYSNPANGKKLVDFNNDFIDSISLFSSTKLISNIIDSIFGTLTVEVNKSKKQIQKELEVEKVIDSIIKTDDDKVINDSYFSFSNDDYKAFERTIENRKKGVSIIQGSTNIESSVPLSDLEGLHYNVITATTPTQTAQAIDNALSNMASSSAGNVADEDVYTAKLNFIDNIVKKLMLSISNVILSPKLILIFAINHAIIYGTSFDDTLDFMKKNKNLIKAVVNGIRDAIISILLKEVLKAVSELVAANMIELQKEKSKAQSAQLSSLAGVPNEVLRMITGLVKS